VSVVIVSAVCLINLFLWFIFFHKFTKIFSTNDIIENTRSELNKMILDINRNTERDITLIEDRIKTLKDIIAEADKRIALAKSEAERKNVVAAYGKVIDSAVAGQISPVAAAANRYRRNASSEGHRNTDTGAQSELFGGGMNTTGQQETAPIEAPVPGPKVYMSDNPVVVKKDFNTEVGERYERGETIEEIATALSRSITEVQFALDMNN
jgi:hypothetical protein